jgi:hypothetical protein
MTDQSIGVNNNVGGTQVDVTEVTTAKGTVERQRTQIGGASGAELADVRNHPPADTDYGLVVRQAPAPYSQLLAADGTTVKVLISQPCVLFAVQNMVNADQTVTVSLFDWNSATGLPTAFYQVQLAAGQIIEFCGERGQRLAHGLVVQASAALNVGANFLAQ